VVFPTRALAVLDRLFLDFRAWLHEKKQGNTKKASADGREPLQAMNRRELVGNLAAFPAVGLLGYGAYKKREFERVHGTTGATITLREVALKDLNGELPTGSLGNLKVSRLILGSNLIGAVAHCRDLLYVQHLFKAYNTERKIFETIELAQKSGINMIQLVPGQYPMFHKYCRLVSDGMQTMCAVTATVQDMKTDIDKAIDAGATTIYVHGLFAERFVQAGRIDLLGKCVDYIKSQGYLAGIGGHSIEVVVQAENAQLDPDYYVKTLHHDNYWSAHPRENRYEFQVSPNLSPDHNQFHDNMFDLFPERTIEVMQRVKKPWFAFKVLAGGAIHPREGFPFAFDNGADFICVGMFDFELVEDVNIALEALSQCSRGPRQWLT
jgi:hypothetical protein